MTGRQYVYEDLKILTEKSLWRPLSQTSFPDALQTKFDPSIRGLVVDGTASESYYCAGDTLSLGSP